MILIDDLSRPHPETALGTRWAMVADTVMGGVSTGRIARVVIAGRAALRLTGTVSTANNGGFIQMATDLAKDGGTLDASDCSALELEVRGNADTYNVHLRTRDIARPWQSYRVSFKAVPEWSPLRIPLAAFQRHRTDAPFNPAQLTRIGLVAIGREMQADLAIARVALA